MPRFIESIGGTVINSSQIKVCRPKQDKHGNWNYEVELRDESRFTVFCKEVEHLQREVIPASPNDMATVVTVIGGQATVQECKVIAWSIGYGDCLPILADWSLASCWNVYVAVAHPDGSLFNQDGSYPDIETFKRDCLDASGFKEAAHKAVEPAAPWLNPETPTPAWMNTEK